MRIKIVILLALCFAIVTSVQENSFAVNVIEESIAKGVFTSDYQPPLEVQKAESELTVELEEQDQEDNQEKKDKEEEDVGGEQI